MKIKKIRYSRHTKTGKPDSLRVDYYENIYTRYSEWVCIEHGGFAARKARQWWLRHGGDPAVTTVTEALQAAGSLKHATRIQVQEDGRYWRVIQRRFEENVEIDVDIEEDFHQVEAEPVKEEEAPF